jgi:Arc/MetJ-type ribon-helix-helix transcriptional regulator
VASSDDTTATRIETVTVRLPKEVVDILDSLVERKLFSNRSEAIREFCRDYVQEGR